MITLWGQGALTFDPASADFTAPLSDAGAGIATVAPTVGTGPATFTRASTAWTKLSTGLWAQIASGQPRSRYGGDTTAVGTYAGFWREAAGTQLVTPTASIRDMTDASWVKTTMTTAKTSTGIDGAANSCTRLTAAGANSTILQTLVAAASSRTYSCFIKRVTGTGNIELTQDGTTFTNIAGSLNSSTFTKVQLNASQLNAVFGIRIVTNADAIDVDFNQFESGAYATSPMDAAGATRAADALSYPGSNADVTVGTAYAEVMLPVNFGTGGGAGYLATSSDATGQTLLKQVGSAVTTISSYDGTNTPQKTGINDPTAVVVKIAASWGAGAILVTGSGLASASGSFDGTMGNGLSIMVGSNAAGNPINGTIKNINIWRRAASDAQLAALTA